ncbi:hypothetical protein F8M41_011141 [Gigaspora margarita]|uniref:Uncharacterized protein n=1 Tax=Gigaspora margarita TaxID=4874 RepID=A0A8H3WZL1_GIGMA|nr:hypothetical protein F8M41_011141 [Gigaspora margarita]
MSKLRAEITWSHRQKLYFTELPSPNFHEENAQDQVNKDNEPREVEPEVESGNEPGIEPEPEEPEKASDDYTLIEGFDEEEVIDSSSLVTEFGGFLDVWVKIITNETEELADTENENEEILGINDIVHPAVDSTAKWDLCTLFNDLELP